MSEEITRRLEEASRVHGRAAVSEVDVSVLAASVVGSARRRRRAAGLAMVAGAFLGMVIVAGGSLAVAASVRTDANPAAPNDAPPVAMSLPPTASAGPLASPESTATIQDYPPIAAARGEGFPAAFEMRDWVWDYVDEGWSIASYAVSRDPAVDKPRTVPDAVVYVVAPDGATFEVARVAPEYSIGLRVVSWQEDARTAHLVWEGDVPAGVPSGGGVLDLETGELEPLVFATPWGESSTVKALAVSATGNELWQAWLGTHQRFYRYGPATGWTVASVNDLEGIGDRTLESRWDTATVADDPRLATRPDSTAVLFELRPWRDGPLEEISVYRVDTDAMVAVAVNFTVPIEPDVVCTMAGWTGRSEVTYDCGGHSESFVTGTPLADTSEGNEYGAAVVAARQWSVWNTGVVGYREPTSASYLVTP